ncbi:bacteriocin immunity protein [Streptococcus suis]|uniref:bacteriocin immunity protein n=1 Tax=Streptococcus suis TaxID=1307 RepID=UPI002A7CEF6A|nr:bacteriocin immunity protein [Streptococcus suis]HEL2093221.1 bacteriocin immunity protein [Streptococcus suis]HEL2099908.1 bacteriocin immunity protein [Streptococcus suis]
METREKIMEELINLILNPTTTAEERKLLVAYKQEFERTRDTERTILALAESIRKLAVRNVFYRISLSPSLSQFYKKISAYGEWEKNLGRGLIATGIIR